MEAGRSQSFPQRAELLATDSLNSWKEIANYLRRDERTVRRWQEQGLPIHRHLHKKRASVYAYKSEIDAWWRTDRSRVEAAEALASASKRGRVWWRWALAAALALPVALVGLNVAGLRDQLLGGAATQHPTIAVLPLKNLTADTEQTYLADGVTEALITQLGKISSLDVISHQSILRYRGTMKSLPEIAHELNVKAVVEGTVLRSGEKIRITANLVQASPERHLWAETFEFEQRDILAVQERVAREVASHVHARLTAADGRRLTANRAVDPEAHEAYLFGRSLLYKARVRGNALKAKEAFEKAIAKDPAYAPPYASLAELHIRTGGAGRGPQSVDGRAALLLQAREWAEKALALDETLAEAHYALAIVHELAWDWAGAEREYRRAIELNNSYAIAHIAYAMLLYAQLHFQEAAAEARRAQQLDPASPYINTWAGAAYFYAGRERDATDALQRALELEPSYSDASLVLARNHVAKGRYRDAQAELERALVLNPKDPAMVAALAHAHGRAGNRGKALELIEQLKGMEAGPRGAFPTFGFIWAYAGLGDKDEAFAWLEKAYAERRGRLASLQVEPMLEPLRTDPRFSDLARRVGLPPRVL
jgi:TolB-like protein/Tfp pilus assembly protein PilF